MAKYPSVAKLFADSFGDEFGVVPAEIRKRLMAQTGRSGATVSRWISGDARPEPDTWNAVAEMAGMDASAVGGIVRGHPIEVDQSAPTPTDDITKVLDLARTMRVGLETSKSRDAKLNQIIGLCDDISHHLAELTLTAVDARDRAERNEAALAALVAQLRPRSRSLASLTRSAAINSRS